MTRQQNTQKGIIKMKLQSIESNMLSAVLQSQLDRACEATGENELKISLCYTKGHGLKIEAHPCPQQVIAMSFIHAYLAYTSTIGETGTQEEIDRENVLMQGFITALEASVDTEAAQEQVENHQD